MTFRKSLFSYISLSVLVFSFVGCEESTPEVEEVIVEKVVVENVDSAEIIANDTAYVQMESELEGLTEENKKERQTVSYLNKQVNSQQAENDSLMTVIHHKDNVISNLAASNQEKISDIELHARAFVQNVNMAWKNLPGAPNNDEMLQYYLPNYGVSMVSVGLTEKAEVGMMYPEEFVKKLNGIRKTDGLTIQIGNVNFLYFDGEDDVYTIVYKAIFRVYQDDVPTSDRAIVATITAKKVDGEFKIGKYSWVSMGHHIN